MKNEKYKLTDETKEVDGHLLHRIECVTPFKIASVGILINEGSLGGWIETECNLSQDNSCWVDHEAMVYENGRVKEDAYVDMKARVCGMATVKSNAMVCGGAVVHGNALVTDKALVTDHADINERAYICGYCRVCDNAMVYGNAKITGHASLFDDARVYGKACIGGNAKLMDHTEVSGYVSIEDGTCLSLSAVVKTRTDFIFIRNSFSSGRGITWTKSNDIYQTGCFHGTAEELIAKAEEDDKVKKKSNVVCKPYHKAEYFRAIVAMVERFKEIGAMDEECFRRAEQKQEC